MSNIIYIFFNGSIHLLDFLTKVHYNLFACNNTHILGSSKRWDPGDEEFIPNDLLKGVASFLSEQFALPRNAAMKNNWRLPYIEHCENEILLYQVNYV